MDPILLECMSSVCLFGLLQHEATTSRQLWHDIHGMSFEQQLEDLTKELRPKDYQTSTRQGRFVEAARALGEGESVEHFQTNRKETCSGR